MTYEEAVKHCEDHECTECEVYLQNKDVRTKDEKCNGHVPYCMNLVDNKTKKKKGK